MGSYNGSGVFVRSYSWQTDALNGIKIRADRMDTEDNGFATNGLTNCITRDGQSPATANIPLGTHKITGLGDGTANTDAANVGQMNTAIAAASAVLSHFITGFGLSNDAGTPNSILDVAAGRATDSLDAVIITGAAITKKTSGSWAAGTNANGMGTGLTIANSTWYHVFAILNAGSFDVYFDTSITAANAPPGTTAYRRIGSFKTDGSAHIKVFKQVGKLIYWSSVISDLSGSGAVSFPTNGTVSAPPGLSTFPILGLDISYSGAIGGSLIVGSPLTNAGVRIAAAPQVTGVTTSTYADWVPTNTSSQITYGNTSSGATYLISTFGWIDLTLADA